MSIGNVELMHVYFPKHSLIGRARMKSNKEIEEGKNRGVSIESSKAST